MLGSITPNIGVGLNITAFAVIVVGTLGNPLGTVVGGIVYGVSLMLMQTYFSSWANLLPNLLLIVMLLVRPRGLLGRQVRRALARLRAHAARPCVPVIAAACAVVPLGYSNELMLFNFVIFLALAQGLNIVYGFTGYLPFGYVGFYGAGAYGFALAVMHLHAPPLAAMAAGGAAAVLLAVVLLPLLRLSGAYFAISSMAAAQAVYEVVSNPALEKITKGPVRRRRFRRCSRRASPTSSRSPSSAAPLRSSCGCETRASAWRCRRSARTR